MACIRITGFEVSELSIALKKPFITALRRVECVNDIIIKVHTNSVHVGYGEACAVTAITGTTNESLMRDLKETLFSLLINTQIDEELIFKKLYACKVSSEAKACIDIALFDILAKQSAQSLHKYLNASSSSLQTDLTISVNEPLLMKDDANKAQEMGFRSLKIKLDHDIQKNIQRLHCINEVILPTTTLRLDPNQALDLQGCLKMLSHINIKNIECIEQPFKAQDIASMKQLKKKSIVPVLADESLFNLQDAHMLLNDEAIDLLNIKLMKCGGIYEGRAMAKLARNFKKDCMIGSMLEGPISLLAAASLGLSQDNIIMADLDSPLYLKAHPLLLPFNLKNDTINLDKKHGLGIDKIMQELKYFPSR